MPRNHRLFNTYTGPVFRVYADRDKRTVEIDPAPPYGSTVLRSVAADDTDAETIRRARLLAATYAAEAARHAGFLLGFQARRALDAEEKRKGEAA